MGRILVVDDSWQILKMLTKLLSNDYLVDTANDGKEALEKIDLNHSLVFTDCRMPNLEGWDLIKKLKTDPSFSSYANISIVGIGNGFFS